MANETAKRPASRYEIKNERKHAYFRRNPNASWQDWLRSSERQAMLQELRAMKSGT